MARYSFVTTRSSLLQIRLRLHRGLVRSHDERVTFEHIGNVKEYIKKKGFLNKMRSHICTIAAWCEGCI